MSFSRDWPRARDRGVRLHLLALHHAVPPPIDLFLYYALAPWFAWIAFRGVRDADPWRWAAAFALAIAASERSTSRIWVSRLIPAALIALYVALYERRGLARLWRWTWRTGMLSALTCSAAIVVLWYSAPDVSANLRTTELPEQWRGRLRGSRAGAASGSGSPIRRSLVACFGRM